MMRFPNRELLVAFGFVFACLVAFAVLQSAVTSLAGAPTIAEVLREDFLTVAAGDSAANSGTNSAAMSAAESAADEAAPLSGELADEAESIDILSDWQFTASPTHRPRPGRGF